MDGFERKRIDELASIHHGAVKLAGAELGVQPFGLPVLDFPAGFADHPEHDHSHDGRRRKLEAGPYGVRILAIGCAPGGGYQRPDAFRVAATR